MWADRVAQELVQLVVSMEEDKPEDLLEMKVQVAGLQILEFHLMDWRTA